jgi:hypothetical protein
MKIAFFLLSLSLQAFGADNVTSDYNCRDRAGKSYEANVFQYARIYKPMSITLYPASSASYSLQPEEYEGSKIGFDAMGKVIEKAQLEVNTLRLKLDCIYFDKSKDSRYGLKTQKNKRVPASKK